MHAFIFSLRCVCMYVFCAGVDVGVWCVLFVCVSGVCMSVWGMVPLPLAWVLEGLACHLLASLGDVMGPLLSAWVLEGLAGPLSACVGAGGPLP